MKLSHDFHASGFDLPAVRHISAGHALRWLGAGWQDLKATPVASLAYGLLFALGGDLIILAAIDSPQLITVSISGFFLVAPLLAAGLYELSRQSGRGRRPSFIESLAVFRDHGESLAQFGLFLALVSLFWERLTAIAFSLLASPGDTAAGPYLYHVAFSGEHLPLLAVWTGLGALVALFVFALSVVSVPMMLDRGSDVVTAMMSSLRAFAANPEALLVWAAIIVGLTLIGFATLLFGLVVLMPIIGHASWHAYRDLVE